MALAAIDQRAHFLQAHSIERSSMLHYRTGLRDYVLFCTRHHLPLHPTPLNLVRYITYTSRFIASAPKYLTGARHFLRQLYPDFDQNRASAIVQATIAGSKKVCADPIRCKQPLRTTHLQMFLDIARQSTSYDDLLFITIVSCAFYACHRIGELILKNDRSLFDWRKIIKRSTLDFFDGRAT